MVESLTGQEQENNSYEVYTDDVFFTDSSKGIRQIEANLVWCGGMTFFDKESGITGLIHFVPYETEEGSRDKLNTAFYQLRSTNLKAVEVHAFMLSEQTENQVKMLFAEKGLASPENERLEMDDHGTHFPLKIEVGTGKIN